MPQVRKNHASSVHLRVVVIQRVSSRPERSGADGEGEGDGEAGEAQVQRGRVDGHPVVLQLRVEPAPVGRDEVHHLERVAGEDHHHHEEGEHGEHRARHVGHELAVAAAVLEDHQRAEERQQERPEHQRPRLPGPQPGDLVEQPQLAVGVARHVLVAELAAHEGGDDGQRGGGQQPEHRVDRALGAENQVAAPAAAAVEAQRGAPAGHQQRQPERDLSDLRHDCLPLKSASVAS